MEPPATQSIETSTKSFQVEEDEQDKVVDEWFVLFVFVLLLYCFVLAAMSALGVYLITYVAAIFVRI
ncbi:hypothetical protein Godav_029416 [Gossypium davidsonii]|uniref:Transmembrane protein n=4 Tax=Gossypium TaxID=3633 RepID=A0A7J8T7P0_GOSDV|nr:hypothetical protein [Gossypium davidsonii]